MTAAAGVLALVGGLGAYWLYNRLPGKVERIDGVFAGLPEQQRPTKEPAVATAVTFLLVGSDSRDGQGTTGTEAGGQVEPGAQRSDTMMLFHLAADRSNATMVSLPRDSWVPIPGKGTMKLNAAYSLGGPTLLVQTVEALSGVRIDHYAVIDFAGFKTIVDNIGGVDVRVAAATKGGATTFTAGLNHLDGNAALDYVRQRHGLPEGDFDRVRRQQNLLRAVLTRVAEMDPFHHPVTMVDLINEATKVISVDSGLTDGALRSLGMSMSGLRGGTVGFMTAPVTGTGMQGSQSVVYLDKGGCAQLWTAIRSDAVPGYLRTNPAQQLPAVPR